MRVSFHRDFRKDLDRLTPHQKRRVDQALELFENHPFDPQLKNHPLHGDLKGRRAIVAGDDLHLVFRQENNYDEVVFLSVGTHNQVY